MSQPGGGEQKGGRRHRRGRDRRPAKPRPRAEPTSPRWSRESGPKTCRKCGGRMYPADWIWQQYGLCLGWRCSQCKEKVLARSLPFKGLRKRKADPDELRDLTEARGRRVEPEEPPRAPGTRQKAGAGRLNAENGRPGGIRRD